VRRSRPSQRRTESYIPLFVTFTILLSWHIFRVAFFTNLSFRCYSIHEFWIASYTRSWPLLGSFVLVFLLLFVWNVAWWFDTETQMATDRALLILNGIALLSIGFSLVRFIDAADLEHYAATGGYRSWNRTTNDWYWAGLSFTQCERARLYLGTWDVKSVDVPFRGQEFPFQWIELRRDLTFIASVGRFAEPIEGWWSPPDYWSAMAWIESKDVEGIWNMKLEGPRLTLTTHEYADLPESKIVLQRR